MAQDLIVFDDQCPFCQSWVMWIIQKDKIKRFGFTGLSGQTIKKFSHLIEERDLAHSVIFIEDFQMSPKAFSYGKAALRILYKIGGFWKVIGFFGFLPKKLIDPIYRLIAKRRMRFCEKEQDFSKVLDRFYS